MYRDGRMKESNLKDSREKQSQMKLCENKQHQLKSLYFCKNCAKPNQPLGSYFYCEQCHPELLVRHKAHSNQNLQLIGDKFCDIYKKFKDDLIRYTRKECLSKMPKDPVISPAEFSKIFKELVQNSGVVFKNGLISESDKNKIVTKDEFQQEGYRRWLMAAKFFEQVPSQNAIVRKDVEEFLLKIFQTAVNDEYAVEIKPIKKSPAKGNAMSYEQEIALLKEREIELKKQKKVGELYIRLTSYFTDEEIEHGLEEIKELENYHTLPFLLYLAKLKICELHSAGSEKLKQILSDKNFPKTNKRELELFHYFSAMSEWKFVKDTSSELEDTVIFFEVRNKKNYKLESPAKYIAALSEAISVEPRALYYASRAIGYMIEGKLQKAEEDFQLAENHNFSNDAMLNNRNFNKIKSGQPLDLSYTTDSLVKCSTDYIVNVCKHLKKIKDFKALKICCEELVTREPENINFRIRNFDAAFKLGDKDGAMDELACIKNIDELEDEEITEYERKIELMKARENDKLKSYQGAESKYEYVAKIGSDCATHWYNYAAFLFNHRDEHQKNDKALAAINKAIEINPKKQYFKLKYLLLFIAGNMEQAKKQHVNLDDPKDQLKLMIEYVNDNA